MRARFCTGTILLLMLFFQTKAQDDRTFTVKKSAKSFKPGFYCSDYMTDGRVCFYFDTLGKVEPFTCDKDLKNIVSQSQLNGNTGYLADYYVYDDSVRFVLKYGISGLGFQKNYSGVMMSYVSGLVNNNEIALNIISTVEGAGLTRKKLTVYRVK